LIPEQFSDYLPPRNHSKRRRFDRDLDKMLRKMDVLACKRRQKTKHASAPATLTQAMIF
jgi:hypothetical protein